MIYSSYNLTMHSYFPCLIALASAVDEISEFMQGIGGSNLQNVFHHFYLLRTSCIQCVNVSQHYYTILPLHQSAMHTLQDCISYRQYL